MSFEVGKTYLTKEGNHVTIVAELEDGSLQGQWSKVGEFQETIVRKFSKWQKDGQWGTFPGGCHDLGAEVQEESDAD